MRPVTFRSASVRLRVDFDPRVFGYRDTAEPEKDRHGQIIIDAETKKPIMKQEHKPSAHFGSEGNSPGGLRLDPRETDQLIMIEDLKRSVGFPEQFWIEEDLSAETEAKLSGKVLLTIPDPFVPEHQALIDSFLPYWNRSVPPAQHERVMGAFTQALKVFDVHGIQVPPEDGAKRLLLGRVRDLLFAFASVGLCKLSDEQGSNGGEGNQQETGEAQGGAA